MLNSTLSAVGQFEALHMYACARMDEKKEGKVSNWVLFDLLLVRRKEEEKKTKKTKKKKEEEETGWKKRDTDTQNNTVVASLLLVCNSWRYQPVVGLEG